MAPKKKRDREEGPRPVTLNVGGETFVSYRHTLLESEFLGGLLSDEMEEATEEIFVDRDPKLFVHILSWLRAQRVPAVVAAGTSTSTAPALFITFIVSLYRPVAAGGSQSGGGVLYLAIAVECV